MSNKHAIRASFSIAVAFLFVVNEPVKDRIS